MSVALRLLGFAVVLALAFGGAALAGGAIDPDGADQAAGHDPGHDDGAGDGHAAMAHGHADATPPGLANAADGLRLDLDHPQRSGPGATRLRFRIVDARGRAVRDFDVEHAKRLHLIVVRRDLRGFVHLHPTMASDGTWSATAELPRAGSYRVFADFRTRGAKRTLGADLELAGAFEPVPLPGPSTTAVTDDGLEVRLRRDGDRVAFDVLRDGRRVNDALQPYLGARGHLVTLRAGDLAYLHTHPDGDALAFEAHLPTAGRYRSWVQFRLDGRVRTAAFTLEEPAS